MFLLCGFMTIFTTGLIIKLIHSTYLNVFNKMQIFASSKFFLYILVIDSIFSGRKLFSGFCIN